MKKPVGDEGLMVAIDASSVVDKGNGIVEVWSREQYSKPQTFHAGPDLRKTKYLTALFRKRIDCRKRLAMTFYMVIRGKANETLSADDVLNPKWKPVVPESVGEAVMIWGCARDYPITQSDH